MDPMYKLQLMIEIFFASFFLAKAISHLDFVKEVFKFL